MGQSSRKSLLDLGKRQKYRKISNSLRAYRKTIERAKTVMSQKFKGSLNVEQGTKISSALSEQQLISEYDSSSGEHTARGFYSDNDSLPTIENPDDFDLKLKQWSIKHKVTLSSLSDLLKVLRKHECHEHLPQDARTFLSTPTSTPIRELAPGHYWHFGLTKGIIIFLKNQKPRGNEFLLKFNIDGLPLFKSPNLQFLPILANIHQTKFIFPVGIYAGDEKPMDVNDFLDEFVSELNEVIANGIEFNGNLYTFCIHSFVCDAPARAYIACITGHTGYCGCGKCTVKGRSLENRIIFTKLRAPLRTDQSFRNREQPKHHKATSLLENLPMDMVSQFPFEYMHLVCLGVVRKLIMLWLGKLGKPGPWRLSRKQVDKISADHIKCAQHMPIEFKRKPRSLREIDRWKATELRTFLLYTGPFVLCDRVKDEMYENFLSLSAAIRILAIPNQTSDLINYAESLLVYFVEKFKTVYGIVNVSYNVHGLIHLAGDVREFGHLEQFSAFHFENYLGQLKRLLTSAHHPLQQIHRRLSERNLITLTAKSDNQAFSCPSSCQVASSQFCSCTIFKKFTVKGFSLGENSFMIDNKSRIYKIIGACRCGSGSIFAYEVKSQSSFFLQPLDSTLLGIFIADSTFGTIKKLKFRKFYSKCIAFPIKNSSNLAVFPMLPLE